MRSDFFDENGNQRLIQSYCVYMDVLGFNQKINDSYSDGTKISLFNKFSNLMTQEIERLKDTHDPDNEKFWEVKVFTDNIVLGFPVGEFNEVNDGEGDFGIVVGQVARYQLFMALEGFFVRGAMTLNELFMDENIVYGTGLLEAYKLESEIALDPRIVLSKPVLDLVKKHMGYYAKKSGSPQYSDVLMDSDGVAFINYLDKTKVDSERLYWNMVEEHKMQIELNLQHYESQPKIWSKYFWLANYHNYFCEQNSNYLGYDPKYLIDDEIAKKHPERIS
jgi:hypothetical protein